MVSSRTRRERLQRRKLLADLQYSSSLLTSHKEQGHVINDSNWLAFRAWLQKARCPRMYITMAEFNSTGRGMLATRDILPGDHLVEIPKQLLITPDGLRQRYQRELSRCQNPPKSHTLMAYHLAVEKMHCGTASYLWPYLSVLPRDFATLPVCYPIELQALLPPDVKEMATKQRTAIDQSYIKLCQNMLKINPNLPRPDKATYEWAWLCVNTRCVFLDNGLNTPSSDCMMIAPFLDMLNHHPDATIHGYYDRKTQCYTMTTQDTFLRGQQAFISYGPHDNGFLLGEYGFVTSENKYNQWVLNLVDIEALSDYLTKLPDTSINTFHKIIYNANNDKMAKLSFLESQGFVGDYAFCQDGTPPNRLLAALRIWFLSRFDLKQRETQQIIERWQRLLYCSLDNNTTVDYPISNSFLQLCICTLSQMGIEQAQQRLDQLTALLDQLDPRYQLAWRFTCQLWKELQAIAQTSQHYIQEQPKQ
ncbi:hypothetical protein BDF19DRAFT_426181 [Syncephalis fuscata]|nr:hypothetical protein BDF19DRAFT_426181 [Syncephalis fuscata]